MVLGVRCIDSIPSCVGPPSSTSSDWNGFSPDALRWLRGLDMLLTVDDIPANLTALTAALGYTSVPTGPCRVSRSVTARASRPLIARSPCRPPSCMLSRAPRQTRDPSARPPRSHDLGNTVGPGVLDLARDGGNPMGAQEQAAQPAMASLLEVVRSAGWPRPKSSPTPPLSCGPTARVTSPQSTCSSTAAPPGPFCTQYHRLLKTRTECARQRDHPASSLCPGRFRTGRAPASR
jgi:hypothetical protein